MAFVETIGLTEINTTLEEAFGDRLRWQMDASEYDNRLDEATHAAAAILNRPYFEDDLTDDQRAAAALAYADSKATTE